MVPRLFLCSGAAMLEAGSRPFAAFFEEACAAAWVRDDLRYVRAPRPDVIGTARLPAAHEPLKLNLCVECLRDRSACVCD